MRHIIILLALSALLISCAPSPEQIERAIEQTQAAKEESYTSTPSNTNTPEPTNIQAPQKETYIVTSGYCLGYDPRYIPTGDPVGFEFCTIDEKRQTPLSSGDKITYSSFMPHSYPSFCAIHTLDGEYITSDIDVNGLGKAVCTLP